MNNTDTNHESEWGIVNISEFENNIDRKRVFVVDDFYKDPYRVRDFALSQIYYPGEGAVGYRTRKQFLSEEIRKSFERIIGIEIPDSNESGQGWHDIGINGRFQACPAGTPSVFHCDSQKWAAIIYLTPDAPTQSGTSFYKHKSTGIRHNTQIDWSTNQHSQVFNQKTFMDPTPYEAVDTVGNVFNRLVIFDGGLIHSGVNYFGWNIESSRLFHIFFFDAK